MINENAWTVQNQDQYEERYDAALARYKETERKRREVESKIREQKSRQIKTKRFVENLRGLRQGTIREFDSSMWNQLLEKAIVERGRITFVFGGEVEVHVSRMEN